MAPWLRVKMYKVTAKNKKIALTLLKVIISFLSIVTLCFWLKEVVPPVLYYLQAGGRLPKWYFYFYVFPVVYLLFCLTSCTKLLRRTTLILAGIIIHIALVAWVAMGMHRHQFTGGRTAGTVFAALWILLCVGRVQDERAAI